MKAKNKTYMIAMDLAGYTYYLEQEKLPLVLMQETWPLAWTANFFFGALFESEEQANNVVILLKQHLSPLFHNYVTISIIEAPDEDEYLKYLEDDYQAQYDA